MRVAMKLHPVILPLTTEEQRLRGRVRLQAQSRRAREALARSCEASGVRLGPLEKGDRNAPLPFDGAFWSLSHKPRFVAAVVGPAPIGIDIEEITPRTEGLHDYIASKAEWALADRSWETFFRFWTAKEAVLKAVGVGLAHLKEARIHAILDTDNLVVDYAARLWHVRHFRFQNHIVSLTHEGHEIAWNLVLEPHALDDPVTVPPQPQA
jgi:4'-phosphopantetheinyl transferase